MRLVEQDFRSVGVEADLEGVFLVAFLVHGAQGIEDSVPGAVAGPGGIGVLGQSRKPCNLVSVGIQDLVRVNV